MRTDNLNIPDEFSFEKEKEIARSFAQRFQWEMMIIGLGQAFVWLSMWFLELMAIFLYWQDFLCYILCMSSVSTIS